jgi:3-isopropylmalate/(R)-2-methylmalate dehydratase small subunit
VEPFVRVSGIAAPLLRSNVDTDAITPSRMRMTLSKRGYGDFLFANWRFDEHGEEQPTFVLNQDPYRQAKILVAGDNFGCGSSRETAVWALRDFGIRAVIAPSFGLIFENNCHRNGMLPVVLASDDHDQLVRETFPPEDDGPPVVTVDLEARVVITKAGTRLGFPVADRVRGSLLRGLDAIDETLLHREAIERYRARDRQRRPWIYASTGADEVS